MSQLKKEIKASMLSLTNINQELSARFCFSREFIGFQGHFPDKPILPGVCKIQAILCMLQENRKKTPRLKEIVSAKFFTPVTYNEEIIFTARPISENNEETRIVALITNHDKKIASIELKVVFP
jgi:3-hydroxyacyl-[acyl-carrier-protein] dehydratase